MAGKGGGSWKVAYADFVTAMMAFFMVMWITAQNQEAKKAVSNYFQDPFARSGESNGPASGLPGGGPAMHRNGEQGKRPGVKVIPSDASGLGTTIQFAAHSADLTDIAKSHLESLAPELAGIPQRIEIRGHASRAPLPPDAPFKDPWSLSYARCQAAMTFLAEHGIEPERIRLSQAGAFQPATNVESAERQKENERVEIFVLREFVSPTLGVEDTAQDDKQNTDSHDEHGAGDHHVEQPLQAHGDPHHAPAPPNGDAHKAAHRESPPAHGKPRVLAHIGEAAQSSAEH